MNFKTHFLLSEAINKTDIVDLYIVMTMPEPMDERYQYTAKEVFEKVKNHITVEIQSILLRELRHMNPTWGKTLTGKQIFGVNLDNTTMIEGLNKTYNILKNQFSYEGSHKYENTEITIDWLAKATGLPWTIDAVINMFNKSDWDGGYGGENWGKLASEAKKLLNAGPADMLKQLDRFVDFVHNNGAVINKFRGFKDGWLQFILDLKQHATNIRDLIPYASYDVRSLFKDPAWRLFMSQVPGKGAAESDDAIIELFIKYAKDIKYIEWDGSFDNYYDNSGDVGFPNPLFSLIDNFGLDRLNNALKNNYNINPRLKKAVRSVASEVAYNLVDASTDLYGFIDSRKLLTLVKTIMSLYPEAASMAGIAPKQKEINQVKNVTNIINKMLPKLQFSKLGAKTQNQLEEFKNQLIKSIKPYLIPFRRTAEMYIDLTDNLDYRDRDFENSINKLTKLLLFAYGKYDLPVQYTDLIDTFETVT